MIVAEWSFNVPAGMRGEYRRFLEEDVRPLWKAAGAAYTAHTCVPKQFFPYQSAEDETRVVEHVRFRRLTDFEAFVKAYEKGDPRYRILEAYETRIHATDPTFRLYEEI